MVKGRQLRLVALGFSSNAALRKMPLRHVIH